MGRVGDCLYWDREDKKAGFTETKRIMGLVRVGVVCVSQDLKVSEHSECG